MNVISDPQQKIPIYSWADRIDPLSLQRLKTLARWDRLAGPIAVMPDIHFSGDVCIGTVLVTEDCVLPTAIGEDLGCGMCSQCFDFDARALDRDALRRLVAEIMKDVPVGRRVHSTPQALSDVLRESALSTGALAHQRDWLGSRHLGTLGGGNHFIELQRDTLNRLWVTVHSGSRGIGAAIASHHARAAMSHDAAEHALPFIGSHSSESNAFLADLHWALIFAAENRKRMLEQVVAILTRHIGNAITSDFFDVPHNVITRETHGGRTLFVHRKGAMPAAPGMRGIIPGSMGTASYIVEGLGNNASYGSCSHGAGRAYSRTEARKRISIKDFRRQMRHVVYPDSSGVETALIEEAPAAYKNIKEVLEQQTDLVKPVLRLEPLAVIKGG